MDNEKELNEKVGKIVLLQAAIEYTLAFWLAKLITPDYVTGTIVTSEMPLKSLTKGLLAIVKYKKENNDEIITKYYDDIINVIKRINKSEQHRNQFAHSVMVSLFNDEVYYRHKVSGKEKGFDFIIEEVKKSDLDVLIKEQSEIGQEIDRLKNLTIKK